MRKVADLNLVDSDKDSFSLKSFLPILEWLPKYRSDDFVQDLIAGLIVSVVYVPQVMAYAMLAGLPPYIGLYASLLPLIIYAIFGTSRTLSVGPVAIVSLLTFSSASAFAEPGSNEFISIAITLALLTGIIQILMGLLRLGFLTNFLSHPVLVGFTASAGLIIAFSQIKHLFGVKLPETKYPYELIFQTILHIPNSNLATTAIGALSILILLYSQIYGKKTLVKLGLSDFSAEAFSKLGPLIAVLTTTLLVWGIELDKKWGVKVIGEIPAGLPPLTIPEIDLAKATSLIMAATVISLVGFMESNAIATALANRRRQKIDPNQELIALGAANLGVSFTSGYPVAGGLARTVVNFNAGAKTPLSSIITFMSVAIVLLFFTPLFYYLPQATLASIVVVAVAKLFDLKAIKRIWEYSKADGTSILATLFGVLIFDVEIGILIGLATSILLFLYRTSKPHVAIVGRVGNTEQFRNVLRHRVKTCPETLAIRIDESLYFANTKELERCIMSKVADNPEIRNVVLICSAVNFIDASALETLEKIIDELRSAGINFYLSEVKGPVMDRLEKIGFVERFGREKIFLSTHQAMEFLGCK
ncbi:MAG: solute carrier family 26 protein [Pyrinomonadaceae bacterium]|nr:solute carrier family 26 protein [Pyrinomonadaceae bacterium]MCX7640422.1 solute carrier family 26 protein [Pyrinomonadaceae bacterium]MDW8304849.1 solute carrier family 26 protein [Acidobacteriota bacterium]